ncbi:MAG: T9SS type A sorting domain-containing protein, partial [Bacteroidota bacterium]
LVKLTNTNAVCTNTISRQLTIAAPNSVEKANGGELKILAYPNPTDGMLNIALETANTIKNIDIQLTDANGTVIYNKHLDELSGSFADKINLNGFADGAYFLTVKQPGGKYSKKIILH